MDFVWVAYDFTNHQVRQVLLPHEIDYNEPLIEMKEEIEEIGNEAEIQNFLDEAESLKI
jgi:hypothetical protein